MERRNEEFEYVYVENDGKVRELNHEEIDYLQAEFEPTDGARPYIKSNYEQLTPDNKVLGFLHRSKVPENINIIKTDVRYAQFGFPINICDSKLKIDLHVGIFSVIVLGGWDIIVGNFTFSLKNTKNGKVINPRSTIWKIQSYEFGEMAKKIMVLDISESGTYSIEFKNQDSLKIWKANFPYIYRLFKSPLPKQFIQIIIK